MTTTALEKTINNERDGRLLTDDQITEAVELFSVGKNRQEVVAHFFETVQFTNEVGNTVSVKVLAVPEPKGITEWKQSRKEAIAYDVIRLYHQNTAPRDIASVLDQLQEFVQAVIDAEQF